MYGAIVSMFSSKSTGDSRRQYEYIEHLDDMQQYIGTSFDFHKMRSDKFSINGTQQWQFSRVVYRTTKLDQSPAGFSFCFCICWKASHARKSLQGVDVLCLVYRYNIISSHSDDASLERNAASHSNFPISSTVNLHIPKVVSIFNRKYVSFLIFLHIVSVSVNCRQIYTFAHTLPVALEMRNYRK